MDIAKSTENQAGILNPMTFSQVAEKLCHKKTTTRQPINKMDFFRHLVVRVVRGSYWGASHSCLVFMPFAFHKKAGPETKYQRGSSLEWKTSSFLEAILTGVKHFLSIS